MSEINKLLGEKFSQKTMGFAARLLGRPKNIGTSCFKVYDLLEKRKIYKLLGFIESFAKCMNQVNLFSKASSRFFGFSYVRKYVHRYS